MSILSNLTIIIPSYNRHNYLIRQINYWKDCDIKLLILDGTTMPNHQLKNSASDNIKVIHLPETIERRLGIAASMIKTKYAAMLSDDEFFLPSSLESIIQFLENNPDYSACKGNAVGFGVDSKGINITGSTIYTELKDYEIVSDAPRTRMVEHMAAYAMASLWAVHRTEVLRTCLTLAGRRPPYASAAAFEIQLSLLTAWCGKIKVLNELMWLRSFENRNIWWESGKLSIVEWLRSKKYSKEVGQFISDLAGTIPTSEEELNHALLAYVRFWNSREGLRSSMRKKKHAIANLLPFMIKKFIRQIFSKHRNDANKSEDTLFHVVQVLSMKGVLVNLDEIKKIEAIVKEFHHARTPLV